MSPAGMCRKWEENLDNDFPAACWVKKGLFQRSTDAGVVAGQKNTMGEKYLAPQQGYAVPRPFPNIRAKHRE